MIRKRTWRERSWERTLTTPTSPRLQLSKQYTHHAATALFLFFGARSLVDAVRAGSGVAGKPSEELREVEEELTPELGTNGKASPAKDDGRKAARIGYPGRGALLAVFSPLFLEAFAVTFLAEWGDKSQISTVAMAAQDGVTGVTIGGTLGHALCTGAAVIGGRELGTKVSARAVEFTAGVLFLLFGIHALLEGAG